MSAQEAFEKWREGLPTVTRWEKTAFLAGYAAAIEDIRNSGAIAFLYSDSEGDAIFGHPDGYFPSDAEPIYCLPKE